MPIHLNLYYVIAMVVVCKTLWKDYQGVAKSPLESLSCYANETSEKVPTALTDMLICPIVLRVLDVAYSSNIPYILLQSQHQDSSKIFPPLAAIMLQNACKTLFAFHVLSTIHLFCLLPTKEMPPVLRYSFLLLFLQLRHLKLLARLYVHHHCCFPILIPPLPRALP